MASVRKFPKSPYWFACFITADGKRRQVSTKETDRDKALIIARAWDDASRPARRKADIEAQFSKILAEIAASVSS